MKSVIWCAAREKLALAALAFASESMGRRVVAYPDSVYSVLIDAGGAITAVTIFWGFEDGITLHCALAGLPGRHWLTRAYLFGWFDYIFEQVGAHRLECTTSQSNHDARRFIASIGFRLEGRKRGAAADGGDLILFGMLRGDCRFLRDK